MRTEKELRQIKELAIELKKIYPDKEFITAVLADTDNEEDRNTMLDFIRSNENVTDETVSVLAIKLANARKN